MPTEPSPQPAEPIVTGEDRQAAFEAEYGRYVALQEIDINGVRAFNEGAPVPIGHVERGLVPLDQVRDLQAEQATDDQNPEA
jgi:hypothetical protein